MQHEKTIGKLIKDSNYLESIKISPCRTFHELLSKPLYKKRFIRVEKFHSPGLAPVYDDIGAYHIDLTGNPVYQNRFTKAFGFYCNRAAVEDNAEYYHINSSGDKTYEQSYEWVGNYQEGICVVRKHDTFFHIDLYGNKIYQETYDYVGDFKDSIAVIYKNGKATHINQYGKLVHNKWYNKLNIFHKGYAIAEDECGWFHIDIQGNPIYHQRFKIVDAFYNGMAKVETFEGRLGQIDSTGNMQVIVSDVDVISKVQKISAELTGFWKTYLTSVAMELGLPSNLPATTQVLSEHLDIIIPNLERLLRSLWEIGLVEYDNDIWQLSEKGKLFQEIPFLAKAAIMWARVAAEDNWLKITDTLRQKSISSFESFKEKEILTDRKIIFYQALLGYSILDTKSFDHRIDISDVNHILLFGIHSLFLTSFKHEAATLYYYNDNKVPREIVEGLGVKIITHEEYKASNYELCIFCRFLQHYDDKKVIAYLELVKRKGIARILLIETILDQNIPVGGSLDINIMVETGGKLRTLVDWENILEQVEGFQVFDIIPLTEYLSVIDIRFL